MEWLIAVVLVVAVVGIVVLSAVGLSMLRSEIDAQRAAFQTEREQWERERAALVEAASGARVPRRPTSAARPKPMFSEAEQAEYATVGTVAPAVPDGD